MNPAGAIRRAATLGAPHHRRISGTSPRETQRALARARKHRGNRACTGESFGGHHDRAENNPGPDRFQ